MRHMIKALMAFSAASLFSITGCVGGISNSDKINATRNIISTVTVLDGNNQSATVGTELPNALAAVIKNSEGQAIEGLTVNFVVTSGGGTVFAPAAASDQSGIVRERWTLGTMAGNQTLEVRAVNSAGAAIVYATFTAIGIPGVPQSINIASGDNQSAQQLQSLALAAKVIFTDAYKNPVAGATVTFLANNEGIASPTSAITKASGEASTTWTLGPTVGNQTLSASASGLTACTFNATATLLPPVLMKISGDSQEVPQYSSLSEPLQLVLTTGTGNHPAGIPYVIFSTASASVNVQVGSGDIATLPAGSLYFKTLGQQSVLATAGGQSVTFFINVIPTTHPYDGLYSCILSHNDYSFYMTISGTSITPSNSTNSHGSLNESTGEVAIFIYFPGTAGLSTNLTGKIVLDSQQPATGNGTATSPAAGTWTCTRL